MHIKFPLCLVLLMQLFVVFPQNQLYQPLQFPDTIPPKYIFDVKKDYNQISSLPYEGAKQKDINRFAEIMTYGKQDLFTSGYIYLNWPELENYVNEVAQQILPDSIKEKKSVHIYITKDASYNAFAIHDGSLFLNIGLFADVVNEAGLAIILAHELSHYIFEDSKADFVKSLKLYTKKNRNDNFVLKINRAKYDRSLERRADSLGFILAEKAGYDLFYGISNFLQFREIEIIEKQKKNQSHIPNLVTTANNPKDTSLSISLNDLLATHPDLSDRISFLDAYLKSSERRSGKKDYIIDKDLFTKFQETAKLENLNILLSQNNFKKCIERSFIYYMLEPENPNYLYFLLESMRRAVYVDKRLNDEGFLSDEFVKFKNGESILHNLHLIIPDSIKFSKIKCVPLTDTANIPFETYSEAFTYFSKLAISNKINESLLTLALYNINNDSLKSKYLNEYCASENVAYKDYATALLKNSIYDDLNGNSKEIILLDDITFVEDHFYGIHNRLILGEKRGPGYVSVLKKMLSKHFPQYDLVELKKLSYENINTKMNYEEAISATTFCLKTRNDNSYTNILNKEKKEENQKQIDLFTLNPEYWNTFKKSGLKSISILDIIAFDDKTKIVKLLNTINPCFWYFIIFRFYDAMFNGSERYAHEVSYYSYDIITKKSKYYSAVTNYKMSKAHFLNSIYYALKTKSSQ